MEGVPRAIGPALSRTTGRGGSPELVGGVGQAKHLSKGNAPPSCGVTLPDAVDSEGRQAGRCRTSGKLSASRFFSPPLPYPRGKEEWYRPGSFIATAQGNTNQALSRYTSLKAGLSCWRCLVNDCPMPSDEGFPVGCFRS